MGRSARAGGPGAAPRVRPKYASSPRSQVASGAAEPPSQASRRRWRAFSATMSSSSGCQSAVASQPGAIAPFRPSSPASRAGPAQSHSTRRSGPWPRARAALHTAGSRSWSDAIPPQARRKSPCASRRGGDAGEWSLTTASNAPRSGGRPRAPRHRTGGAHGPVAGGNLLGGEVGWWGSLGGPRPARASARAAASAGVPTCTRTAAHARAREQQPPAATSASTGRAMTGGRPRVRTAPSAAARAPREAPRAP
jgi:hypothetical protein